MKNKEKFAEELLNIIIYNETLAFNVDKHTVKGCSETPCISCLFYNVCRSHEDDISDVRRKWLDEEYVEPEPEIDWSKVPVDTPIFVRNSIDDKWLPRYFCKYENKRVYTWCNGATSWSAEGHTLARKYAKLVEEKSHNYDKVVEKSNEDQVDWSKVLVDTPILVRNLEDDDWKIRHFAEYDNGTVFAWADGMTSSEARDIYDSLPWRQAKLLKEFEAESNEVCIDWTKIPVDTPVLVKDYQDHNWHKRYFAKYENGKVYTWDLGNTSRSIDNTNHITNWKYAKLADSE